MQRSNNVTRKPHCYPEATLPGSNNVTRKPRYPEATLPGSHIVIRKPHCDPEATPPREGDPTSPSIARRDAGVNTPRTHGGMRRTHGSGYNPELHMRTPHNRAKRAAPGCAHWRRTTGFRSRPWLDSGSSLDRRKIVPHPASRVNTPRMHGDMRPVHGFWGCVGDPDVVQWDIDREQEIRTCRTDT